MDGHSRRPGGSLPSGGERRPEQAHSCSSHICVAHVTGQTTFTGAQPSMKHCPLPQFFSNSGHWGRGSPWATSGHPGAVWVFTSGAGKKGQRKSLGHLHPCLELGRRPEAAVNAVLEQGAQDQHPDGLARGGWGRLGAILLPGSPARTDGRLPGGHQPSRAEGFDPNQNFHASWQTKSGRGVSTKNLAPGPDSLSPRDTGLLAPLRAPRLSLGRPSGAGWGGPDRASAQS